MAKVITKAALARELGYSRARITQLADKGMPVRVDGRLDRARALAWIEKYGASHSGGWLCRGKGAGIAHKASRALNDFGSVFLEGQLDLYAEIRLRLIELPALLVRVGVPVPVAAASAEAMDIILGTWVLNYGPELVCETDEALPNPDYKALARLAKVPMKAKSWEMERNALVDRVVALVTPDEVTKSKGKE